MYLKVHAYMNIRGIDIKPAADTMAKHMRMQMKASDGWIR
jgi:hypothetical protein